jgi:hypothetical protein
MSECVGNSVSCLVANVHCNKNKNKKKQLYTWKWSLALFIIAAIEKFIFYGGGT